mmetsp:Transcript_15343/g.19734  ORF Transcript_15343/g.19734 Transcript_15343/m.19734 type:complete len:437 (-) Transcript_15343:121-1431(-)
MEELESRYSELKSQQSAQMGNEKMRDEQIEGYAEEIEALRSKLSQLNEKDEIILLRENELASSAKEITSLQEAFDELQDRVTATMASESVLQRRIEELENEVMNLHRENNSKVEHIRELEVGLKEKDILEHDLRSRMEQKHTSVMGQLDEIERLRGELDNRQKIIESLKSDLRHTASAKQSLNKLEAELKATRADLNVAENDKNRYAVELDNLNKALTNITNGGKKRQQTYESQIQNLKKEKAELEKQVAEIVPELQESLDEISGLKEDLEIYKSKTSRLNKELQTVERRMSMQSIERHVSVDEADTGVVPTLATTTLVKAESADSAEEDIIKTDVIKKLFLTYFAQNKPKDILVMMANVMDMSAEERAQIGLDKPDQTRLEGLLAATSSSTGMLSKVIFGQEKEVAPPVDWAAVEKKVKEKSFGDVFQEFLNEDL